MGIRGRLAALAALAGLAAVFAASGASADDFDRSGFYLGVGGTYGIHLFGSQVQDALGNAVSVEDTGGVNARMGYRLASFLALEAQYEWMAGFDLTAPVVGDLATLSAHTATVNLKILLPFWRLQPYLLVGPGATYYRLEDRVLGAFATDQWNFAGRAAVGLDAYVTKNVVANVEVGAVLTTHDLKAPTSTHGISALHYLGIQFGLQYRY
jgi:opacity protein-like surface antigen